MNQDFIIGGDDRVLVTGAGGFMGVRLVPLLIERGFRNIRCLARSARAISRLEALRDSAPADTHIEVLPGNLLSRDDCKAAAQGVSVIYHLAAGRGEKSIPDAFVNSVVTTRNLIEAAIASQSVKRFVNVSSFTVYSNAQNGKRRLLDETSPTEQHPAERGDAYSFAKIKQEEIVMEYGDRLPYVILRPGYVYGPGNEGLTGRVGIGTFGLFLHLGGGNPIPLSYVDNCVEAIALAGLVPGVEREVFNVVDDDLPTSRRLLRQYKKSVRKFASIYLPHAISYALCSCWEWYSKWSRGQLPPAFNRRMWKANWRRTSYSNQKLKRRLGWTQSVPTAEGLRRHFEACREKLQHA